LIAFANLALRSQADSRITKNGCAARKTEEAIKYANSSLLERLVAIVDNFELAFSARAAKAKTRPSIRACVVLKNQLNDFLAENDCSRSTRFPRNSIRIA